MHVPMDVERDSTAENPATCNKFPITPLLTVGYSTRLGSTWSFELIMFNVMALVSTRDVMTNSGK